jgi:hypothetical protein
MDNSLLKKEIVGNTLKLEIELEDLITLFETNPHNFMNAKIKQSEKEAFGKYILKKIEDDHPYDENVPLWGKMFDYVFEDILECAENFVEWPEEEE